MIGKTYQDSYNTIKESLRDCSCTREEKEKVQFICLEPTCPDYRSMPLYCMQCMDEEIFHKSHRPVSIVKHSQKLRDEWKDLSKKYLETVQACRPFFKLRLPFIAFTHAEGLPQTVTAELQKLKSDYESIERLQEALRVHI